jgi:hypothetical protein
MAYIGKTPTIGNFQKCDAITVVNGQAAYTMQVGGTNVSPESENHMLVSLNGILQAPVDSFTISNSTITFASNLQTGDSIDFIMILGNVLDLGTPSDNTVSTAKLVDSAVTNAKVAASIINSQTAETSIAGADEVLIYDTSASALRKMTRTNFVSGVGGANTPAFHAYLSSSQSVSDNSNTKAQINTEIYDTDNCYDNSTNYRFTPTTAGKYFVYASVDCDSGYFLRFVNCKVQIKKNGSTIVAGFRHDTEQSTGVGDGVSTTGHVYATVDMNGSSDYVEVFGQVNNNGGTPEFEADNRKTYFGAYRIIT